MSKIKKIKRIFFWSAITAALYVSSTDISTEYLYRHKDSEIEQYVQENLEQVIQKQKEKIGINYPTERPKIVYTFPERYIGRGNIGLYNDQQDTIYLPSGLLTHPKWDFSDLIAVITTLNHTANVKRVLDHELTHFYCDKLKERVLGRYYLLAQNHLLFSEEELLADKLINEGIAEYVENSMNGEDKKKFNFQEWPLEIEQFTNDTIYRGGYALIKPIIDQYKEKGIQFLLFNPPTEKELLAPQEYQKRTLKDLAKLYPI